VVLALGVFTQVALKGLKPALIESGRLLQAENEVEGRYQSEQRRERELERIQRALRDPIFLERERRQLEDPASGLLGR
jgi:hypothetical protein